MKVIFGIYRKCYTFYAYVHYMVIVFSKLTFKKGNKLLNI